MLEFKANTYKRIAIFTVFVMAVFLLANAIFSAPALAAQDPNVVFYGGLRNQIGDAIGLGEAQDPRIIAANIIRVFLGFLGLIAVVLIIYAGWLWMTSKGEEQKIENAKNVIKNAIIGLIIIMAAFGIVTFILNKFLGAVGGGGGADGPPGPGPGGLPALGAGIIESHYPGRDQTGVPRNTKIVITFKEAIDSKTICKDDVVANGICDNGEEIIPENIRLYKTNAGDSCVFAGGVWTCSNNVITLTVSQTPDNKTFVFRQTPPFIGSPSENIWYTVALSTGILKVNGGAAFPGVVGNIGYSWSFEVSTIIDITPPKITSIIPLPDSTEPRNVVIQINFNEAIDPTSASGKTADGFNNIEVRNITGGGVTAGIFFISNQYKTVEFLTEADCGTNSCGDTIYCLPASSTLSPLVKAATLETATTPDAMILPTGGYDGLVDMADNSLDGNGDGTAQGPQNPAAGGFGSSKPPYNANNPDVLNQGDDYEWTFKTNNTIDITAPTIESINPGIGAAGVGLDTVPQAVFSKILMSSTLNSTNINLIPSAGLINYWIDKSDNAGKTTVYISHDLFSDLTNYKPQFKSGLKDIYQNCYSPCSGVDQFGNPVTATPLTPSCCEGVLTPGATCP